MFHLIQKEENNVEFFPTAPQVCQVIAADNGSLLLQAGAPQIFIDQLAGFVTLVHKYSALCSAAQGLDTKLTGAAEQIQNMSAGDVEVND